MTPQTDDLLRDLMAERAATQELRQTVRRQAHAIDELTRLLVQAEALASRYQLGVFLRDA